MKIDTKKYESLTASQWEEKIFHRAINNKYPEQLRLLVQKGYPKKIKRLNKLLIAHATLDQNKISAVIEMLGLGFIKDLEESGILLKDFIEQDCEFLNEKIQRLIDKYATCEKMISLRESKAIPEKNEWEMHGTIYYIDLTAGSDAADGLGIATAWKTIAKYTTTTVRTAGDIAKVRANTTESIAAVIACDEDGTADAMIAIKGCSIADDPWSDASDVKPILDFQNTSAYYLNNYGDNYWKYDTLHFYNNPNTIAGALSISYSEGCKVINCEFSTNYTGLYSTAIVIFELINSEFLTGTYGFRSTSLYIYPIRDCTFDELTYGIQQNSMSIFNLINCRFGQSIAIVTADIRWTSGVPILQARNCIWDKGIANFGTYVEQGQLFFFDDNAEVFEAHKSNDYMLQIDRDTGVLHVGGADSSLKTTFASGGTGCTLNVPASCALWNPSGLLKVWLAASVEKTITIYIRGYGWTGFPAADELFLRAEYLSNGATAARTTIDSDEVIADNVNWVGFQVTLTPARDGFVYLDVILAEYEVSSGIYIDIKPVIS